MFPGQNKMKAPIERHPAMVRENQTDSCLPCQNGTAKNPKTHWRHKGTGAPPPRPATVGPGTPPAPPDDGETIQSSETEGVPPGYQYIHTQLPSARFLNHDSHAKEHMHDKDLSPDLLTDEGPSTGWYTISCVVTELSSIL